jgi:hypothetical protein
MECQGQGMGGEAVAVFGAALGGAALGSLLSSAGAYLITCAGHRRKLRVEVYQDLLPSALRQAEVQQALTFDSDTVHSDDIFKMLRSVQAVVHTATSALRKDHRETAAIREAIDVLRADVRGDLPMALSAIGAARHPIASVRLQGSVGRVVQTLREYQARLETKLAGR